MLASKLYNRGEVFQTGIQLPSRTLSRCEKRKKLQLQLMTYLPKTSKAKARIQLGLGLEGLQARVRAMARS